MATLTRQDLSQEEIQQLWQQFKADPDNEQLRNQLVEIYLPLVRYNAERIWSRLPDGVDMDDLISAGVFGLMDAIAAFDLSRGVKFETYCVPRIRGAMLDELRTMDWVPRLVRSKASKLNEAIKNLEARLGRHPNEQELAEELGISLQELEKLQREATAVNMVSLDKKWYETDSYKDVREIDILEDKKSEDPTRRLQKKELMRLVTRGLNRNERLIIILYYLEEMTMKEIGATLDLSESRVSQMHSSIVQRLKQQLQRRRHQELAGNREELGGGQRLGLGVAEDAAGLRPLDVLEQVVGVDALFVDDRAGHVGDGHDLGAVVEKGARRGVAHVTEALQHHAAALDGQIDLLGRRRGGEEDAVAGGVLPPQRAANGDGLAGDHAGGGGTHVHRVGVHHPGHLALSGAHVGRGNVLLGADEDADLGGVPAGDALDLAGRELGSSRRPGP